jgi:hypothetical protein
VPWWVWALMFLAGSIGVLVIIGLLLWRIGRELDRL